MTLKKFIRSRLFFGFKIFSRVLVFAFGLYLAIDDMIWHNIGGFREITGSTPAIGVVSEIKFLGMHVHHGHIGLLFMFLGAVSLVLMTMERRGKFSD